MTLPVGTDTVADRGAQRMRGWTGPMQRLRREAVTGRLLSRRETVRFGVWNVRTLRRSGKTEHATGLGNEAVRTLLCCSY